MKNLGLISLGVVALGAALYVAVSPSRSAFDARIRGGALFPLDRTEGVLIGTSRTSDDKVTGQWIVKVRSDGPEVWRQKIGPMTRVYAIEATDSLILLAAWVDDQTSILALDRDTGKSRWSTVVDERAALQAALRVDGERVYVKALMQTENRVHALSVADGSKLWDERTFESSMELPMLGPGRLVLHTAADTDLDAEIDGTTGEVRPLPFRYDCALPDGAVLASDPTHVFVVQPGAKDAPRPLAALPPGTRPNGAFCGERGGDPIFTIRAANDKPTDLVRVDARTGAITWTVHLDEVKPWHDSGPVLPRFIPVMNFLGNNYIAVVDLDQGAMTKHDIDGFLLGTPDPTFAKSILSSAFIHGGRAYFLHEDSRLTVLDPDTGEILRAVSFGDLRAGSTGMSLETSDVEKLSRLGQLWVSKGESDRLILDLESMRVVHAHGNAAMHSVDVRR